MAAALRRLVLPTISRRLASRQPIPSFTGGGNAAQGRQAEKCTSLRSYSSEAAAREERRERMIYKQTRANVLLNLPIWAGVALLFYGFYRDHNRRVQEKATRLSDLRSILGYYRSLGSEKAMQSSTDESNS